MVEANGMHRGAPQDVPGSRPDPDRSRRPLEPEQQTSTFRHTSRTSTMYPSGKSRRRSMSGNGQTMLSDTRFGKGVNRQRAFGNVTADAVRGEAAVLVDRHS